jgi:hypothetical protein
MATSELTSSDINENLYTNCLLTQQNKRSNSSSNIAKQKKQKKHKKKNE